MIYLDNAATSWPKPAEVLTAMTSVLKRAGGNPGRSGHRMSVDAARVVYEAREEIADFFNAPDPSRIIFTNNATHAINLTLHGLLKSGDHVVTTSMEHNAVMRPLRLLEKRGVNLTVVPCAADGSLNPADIAYALKPDTKLVVINFVSNVVGTILPVPEVAILAHKVGASVLVDAAQAAGALPIDISSMGIDLLAFTGHKGLLGPTGTGGLVISESFDSSRIEPLMQGGTGSQSEFEEQPRYLPDKFESGTINLVGISGLLAGIQFIKSRGLTTIRAHEKELTKRLLEGLVDIKGITIYGPVNPAKITATISVKLKDQLVSETGMILDERYGILSRVGLHCSPAAHKTIGSFPEGTVRIAAGPFTTVEEIQTTLKALKEVARL